MNLISLLLRVIAIIAAGTACILFFISKGKLAEEVAARKAADKVTRETQAELTKASEEIDSLSTSLKREQEALSNTNRELESTLSEMYTARQEVSRTQQQLSAAKKSIKNLEENAKLLRNDLLQAEQSLASNNNEIELENLNVQIAKLKKNNADLNESLEIALSGIGNKNNIQKSADEDSLSSSYNDTAITTATTSPFGPETEVLSLKDGLIVLSNDASLGLVAGTQAKIIQKKRSVGSIQVIKSDSKMILASILPGSNTNAITAGATISILH